MSSQPPDDIMSAALFIRNCRTKTFLTRAEKEAINRAKLKIAFWACRAENIAASRENLVYVLGEDAKDIMERFDKYLEREGDANGKGELGRKKGEGASFWDNV